jgi:phosphoserine phosphatase
MRHDGERPKIIVTTDVNGTTTPDNTFGELVRADGLFDRMENLMKDYTSGGCRFSSVLPKMKQLAAGVDRLRLESYARGMPLYNGVISTFDDLSQSGNVDARCALSTTGFAGLMALVNKIRHRSLFSVAASPALVDLLNQEEKYCLIRPITDEEEKVQVIDDLISLHRPGKCNIFHIGDTMGDFPALKHAAELGGTGVAFNPNGPLRVSISRLPRDVRTRICEINFTDQETPDYTKVGDIIRVAVWKTLRTQL